MAQYLDSRSDLRRVFYQILGVKPNDPVLQEYDAEPEETADRLIYQGLLNAQSWLLTFTPYRGWRTSASLTLQDAASDGTRFAAFPSDMLRFAGDEEDSALRQSNGLPWGQMVHERQNDINGSYYWIDQEQLSGVWTDGIRFAKSADIPAQGLSLRYHFRHPELTDAANEIVFPVEDRILIPAEAAVMAVHEAWSPLVEMSDRQMILANLEHHRNNAAHRARRSRSPSKMRTRQGKFGTRSFH